MRAEMDVPFGFLKRWKNGYRNKYLNVITQLMPLLREREGHWKRCPSLFT